MFKSVRTYFPPSNKFSILPKLYRVIAHNPIIIKIQGKTISQNRPLISLLKYLSLFITSAKKCIPNIFTGFFSLIEFKSKLSTSS